MKGTRFEDIGSAKLPAKESLPERDIDYEPNATRSSPSASARSTSLFSPRPSSVASRVVAAGSHAAIQPSHDHEDSGRKLQDHWIAVERLPAEGGAEPELGPDSPEAYDQASLQKRCSLSVDLVAEGNARYIFGTLLSISANERTRDRLGCPALTDPHNEDSSGNRVEKASARRPASEVEPVRG